MISILVAYTKKNRIIGSEGKIPWNLPSERNRFKLITKNKYILMGRKSFEEIGHGLSYCTIIIISKSMKKAPEGCLLATSLEKAISMVQKLYSSSGEDGEILVAGGGQIYRQALALPQTNKIYATEIEGDFSGDVTFPTLNGMWHCEIESEKEECGIKYKYVTYFKG